MSNSLPLGGNKTLNSNSGSVIISHDANSQLDINLSAFLLLNNNKVANEESIIFFNQPNSQNGAVQFIAPVTSNNKTKHQLNFDLSRLPSGIYKIVVCLSEEQGIGLSGVNQLKIELQAGNEAINIKSEQLSGLNSLIVLELYLRNNQPKVKAVCQGFPTGLESLCHHYGVTVNDNSTPPTPPSNNQRSSLVNSINSEYYIILILSILGFLVLAVPLLSSVIEEIPTNHTEDWFWHYWLLLKLLIITILFGHFISALWRWNLNHLAQSWLATEAEAVILSWYEDNCDSTSSSFIENTYTFFIENTYTFIEDTIFEGIFLFIGVFFSYYSINIPYRYTINGYNYSNNIYSYVNNRFYFEKNMNRIINLYPAGQRITIYYNPDNPTMSVINREPKSLLTIFFKTNWLFHCMLLTLIYSFIILCINIRQLIALFYV